MKCSGLSSGMLLSTWNQMIRPFAFLASIAIAREMAAFWRHHNSAGSIFKHLIATHNADWQDNFERDHMITAAAILVEGQKESLRLQEEAIGQEVATVLAGHGLGSLWEEESKAPLSGGSEALTEL